MRQWSWADWIGLERHGQPGGPGSGAIGDLGPVPYRRESRFDRVSRAQMHPVLGGVVAEREQLVQVAGDLRAGLGELGAVDGLEGLGRGPGVVLALGAPDLCQ